MADRKSISIVASKLLQSAISRWENEGGAGPCGSLGSSDSREAHSNAPPLTDAELVQLRIRVIALENLMIALLAETPEKQLDIAHEMAAYTGAAPRRDRSSSGWDARRRCARP